MPQQTHTQQLQARRKTTRPPLLLSVGCLFFFALLLSSSTAFAQSNCESPNLLMVLDRSGSMAFTGGSYVRSGKTCSSTNQCSPMNRTYQPSPGTTPRYSHTCSGSRCNYTRWDVATNALKEIVYRFGGTAPGYTNGKVRFGLEYFNSGGSVAAGIPSTPPTIRTSLTNTNASGGTHYGNAFSTARSHLISVVNADSVKRRPTHILFITDGDPGDGCTNSVNIVRDLFNGTGTNRLQDNQGNIYKVKTYVIGFGSGLSSSGQACLNSIAAAGGTQRCNPSVSGCVAYFAADNDVQLNNAMSSIINNATQEVCDNLDNDCDGQTDEGLSRSCSTACGNGTQTCSRGNWGACSSGTPTSEKCNGRDDDCDGSIDENWGNKGKACAVGTGACRRTGTYVCNSNGSGLRCSANAGSPTAEKCDGIDNDCDGSIDENFGNKGQSCTVGKGICVRTGTYVCNSNGSGTTCSAKPGTPQAEKCDGIDNDCDGNIDENFGNKGQSCTVGKGICKRTGTYVCNSNGSGTTCSAKPGPPQTEKCDGIDNDCDGQTDEGCQCIDGRTETCFSGSSGCTKSGSSFSCTSPCKTGTRTCANGRWGACLGQVLPVAEKCDGKDNDCDGLVDESWGNKGKSCSVGVGACKRTGKWRCKSNQTGIECSVKPGAPKAETCNNIDDDCDGNIDENVTQACSTPCESGTETCSKGKWINCSARKPVKEKCNNFDDDCDGQIDEDFSNKNKTCRVGVGVCQRTGKWQCKNDESGTECSAQPGPPSKEVCNGKDDDCDGSTDEDFKNLGQSCSSGLGACKRSGKFICTQDGKSTQCSVPGGSPSPEVCDGIDNNCNGQTDEGLRKACKTICGSGVQLCQNGAWGSCDAPKPKAETCNGKDDDCDGQVDGHKQPCQTICGKGQETCVAGRWVFCDAQKPEPEICDGKDNDCNGQTDDGIQPKKCNGACGTGTAVCQNGKFTGCSGPQPEPEVCDGKDNDCDGQIDNGITRDCKGKCGPGRELCSNGTWLACNAPPPKPEVCDGKDNDCDGVPDNNAKCPQGSECKEGKCELKCRNGECPGGSFCNDDGHCEGDLCSRIKCPSGKQCVAGKCVAACDLVTCASDHVCENGTCIKDDCYRNGCPSKQRCVRGICELDPCQDVSCASDQFCRDGKCIDSCANVSCATDEKCVDGICRPDPKTTGPCANVNCNADEVCDKGVCVSDPCKNVECPKGKACVEGICDHDPCTNIECPSKQKCVAGQCIDNPGGTDPENTTNPDGGGTTNPDGGGTTNPDGSTTNPDGSTTNPTGDKPSNGGDQGTNTENGGQQPDQIVSDTTIGGNNNPPGSEGGQRYAPGCGCQGQQTPFAPLGIALGLLMLGLLRRRKRTN